jgi:hypothetical protein
MMPRGVTHSTDGVGHDAIASVIHSHMKSLTSTPSGRSYAMAISTSMGKARAYPQLLAILGCPHVVAGRLVQAELPETHRCQIETSLLELLAKVASNLGDPVCERASVLAGLYAARCWRRCLESEDGTYDFASVLLCYLERFSSLSLVDVHAAGRVCDILNAWLSPEVPWSQVPTSDEVVQRLFGVAWCTMSLPMEGRTAGSVVYYERPPFLPGLCPPQDALPGVPLPDEMGLSI